MFFFFLIEDFHSVILPIEVIHMHETTYYPGLKQAQTSEQSGKINQKTRGDASVLFDGQLSVFGYDWDTCTVTSWVPCFRPYYLPPHVRAQSCLTFCNPVDWSPPGSSVPGVLQARKTGVGCHFPLQRIFPNKGSNLCLLYGRRILYH